MPHLVNLVVYRRILGDVGVALWYVGFGLIVVVVTDEISYSVVGKHFSEFVIKLGG